MSEGRKIAILGTGGTIAGLGDAQGGGVGYQAGQLGVAQLLQPIADQARLPSGRGGLLLQQVVRTERLTPFVR